MHNSNKEEAAINQEEQIELRGKKLRREPWSSHLAGKMLVEAQADEEGLDMPLSSPLKLDEDAARGDCLFLVGSEIMGRGMDELGYELMLKFFRAMVHQSAVPLHIIFFNSGAKVCDGASPVRLELEMLKEMGCALHVWQSSLEPYGLTADTSLASPINSTSMAQLIMEAKRVVTIS